MKFNRRIGISIAIFVAGFIFGYVVLPHIFHFKRAEWDRKFEQNLWHQRPWHQY